MNQVSSLNRAIVYGQLTKLQTGLSLEIVPVIIPNQGNRYLRQFFKIRSVCAFLFPTVHMLPNPCFYLVILVYIVNLFDSVSLLKSNLYLAVKRGDV